MKTVTRVHIAVTERELQQLITACYVLRKTKKQWGIKALIEQLQSNVPVRQPRMKKK